MHWVCFGMIGNYVIFIVQKVNNNFCLNICVHNVFSLGDDFDAECCR